MKKGMILGAVGCMTTAIIGVVIWLFRKNKTAAETRRGRRNERD